LLTHPTCDRLEAIGLTGMAQALHEQRRAGAKRLATRLRFAALRHAACVEDIDMRRRG
jgi:hypothetical protein